MLLSRNVELLRAGRARRLGHQRRAVVHQRLIRLVRPIPFQHREFGMMQRAALAVAEHAGEIEDARLARRQQLLAGEFRRGAQIERRRSPPGAISSVAKACRWVSLPGETCKAAVSTSTKSGRRTRPARRRRCARAPAGTAGGRHGRRAARTAGFSHITSAEAGLRKTGIRRQDRYGAARNRGPAPP